MTFIRAVDYQNHRERQPNVVVPRQTGLWPVDNDTSSWWSVSSPTNMARPPESAHPRDVPGESVSLNPPHTPPEAGRPCDRSGHRRRASQSSVWHKEPSCSGLVVAQIDSHCLWSLVQPGSDMSRRQEAGPWTRHARVVLVWLNVGGQHPHGTLWPVFPPETNNSSHKTDYSQASSQGPVV